MIGFSVEELQKRGLRKSQMFVSLGRLMQCGMGKCTHCNIGHQYVCIDGPVFNLSRLEKLPEDD